MTLEEIWDRFSDRIAEIELIQRSTKNSAKEELKALSQYYEQLAGNPELRDASVSIHNMTFKDARSGKTYSYQHREESIEDRQLSVLLRKNRQYQWLMAEAYEEFEDFLHVLYSYCGYSNSNFWPLADYGKIKLADIAGKDFQWHVQQSKLKKGAPKSILQSFRQSFSLLPTAEISNKLEVDLAFAIILIEKLRHIIVHNGGRTTDRNSFVELVAKEAGIFNNGCIAQDNQNFITQFFGEGQYENMVALLEVRVRPELPFELHFCRFGILSGILMSYAHLLLEMVRAYVEPREGS